MITLVVTLLVGCGVVLAAGTAAADGSDDAALAAAEAGNDDPRNGDAGNGDAGNGDAGNDGAGNGGDRARDGRADRNDGGDPRNQDRNGRNNNDGRNNNNDDNNNNNDDDEFPGRDKIAKASDDDFVDIKDVKPDNDKPKNGKDASKGSFVARCGTNENNHRNSDNFMVAPGKRNGAQHVHDYVGNLSTDANSDDDSLHAAGTTCDRDNKSTFFWPVLRDTSKKGDDVDEDGGGKDGNFGEILRPRTADLRFVGNPTSKVEAMPDDLEIIMGDAKAKTNGDKNALAQWTCTGFENRITDKYPLCPSGSRLVRILEFPGCWDGKNLDSADFRSHVAFADDDGNCRDDFKVIPQLRVTLTYDRPNGRDFALDTFPDQQHDPRTDHSDFMNIAEDGVLKLMADCINSGKNC